MQIEAGRDLIKVLEPSAFQEAFLSPSVKSTLYGVKNTADTVAEKSKQFLNELEVNLSKTSIPNLRDHTYKIATQVERIFNILGCIPFIGSFSGSLRAAAGHLQVLAGAVLAGAGQIGIFTSRTRHSESEIELKWKMVSTLGAELILHGCLNIIRGYGESLLGYYSLGLANVILLIPNMYKEDSFSPYFAYGAMKEQLSI